MTLATDLLVLHGFSVLQARTGARALVLAEEAHPDVILMDISLKGIDGFKITAMLKQNPTTAPIPVVALTAYAMPHDRTKAEQVGCAGFIEKPINTRTFPAIVTSFVPKGGVAHG